MNTKTVSLSVLLAMSSGVANAQMTDPNLSQKNRVYTQIRKELKNSGLTSSDVLDILEAIQQEIPNKPNNPGPLDVWTTQKF